MIVNELLGGLAAKLAAVGLGVAATATAGAVAVLPEAADNAVDNSNRPALSVPVPDLDNGADDSENGATPPDSNANAAATGLDRARSTPAGAHIPAFVPGPPNGVPPESNANAANTGLDRARQTPAGAHIPDFVPGPPGDRPAGPPAGTPGARGTDSADQTQAGARRPR